MRVRVGRYVHKAQQRIRILDLALLVVIDEISVDKAEYDWTRFNRSNWNMKHGHIIKWMFDMKKKLKSKFLGFPVNATNGCENSKRIKFYNSEYGNFSSRHPFYMVSI